MRAADVIERIRLATRERGREVGRRPMVVVLSESGREVLAVGSGWKGALDPREMSTIFGVPIEIDDSSHPRAWGVLDAHRDVIDCGTIDLP